MTLTRRPFLDGSCSPCAVVDFDAASGRISSPGAADPVTTDAKAAWVLVRFDGEPSDRLQFRWNRPIRILIGPRRKK